MSKSFVLNFCPPALYTQSALWFVFQNEEILLDSTSTSFKIPKFSDINSLNLNVAQKCYLGMYGNIPCFTAQVSQIPVTSLPFGMKFHAVRQSYAIIDNEEIFLIVTRAMQILHWDRRTQFCGCCGEKTKSSDTELSKICTHCKALFFTQLSPVVLILIWRKGEILLGRSPDFMPGIYSIFSGFVEAGETLEQSVTREAKEEVGICIKNINYFSSQSWPFPSNLMLGFIAEYDSGDIQIDTDELEDAQWYSIKKLPNLPSKISLSRRMIDTHIASKY